jgi:hypothetical protein
MTRVAFLPKHRMRQMPASGQQTAAAHWFFNQDRVAAELAYFRYASLGGFVIRERGETLLRAVPR